jgi:hypothetical protein
VALPEDLEQRSSGEKRDELTRRMLLKVPRCEHALPSPIRGAITLIAFSSSSLHCIVLPGVPRTAPVCEISAVRLL